MFSLAKNIYFSKFLVSSIKKKSLKRFINILGIETSCDDTGIAIVNDNGEVLANVLNSQQQIHVRYGGIIPPRAQELHRERILSTFEKCLEASKLEPEKIDAIAVTNRPGLPLSLLVGLRFAKHLGRRYNKPIIPVHHMEAHALQARMEHKIPFPFLCLLISGGHCQLTFVKSPNDFLLLGDTLDDAPGEAFDKISRRLRLYMIPKYRCWNGGQAIEDLASYATDPNAYEFPLPLSRQRNCRFSFAGIKNNSYRAIRQKELEEVTPPDGLISNVPDFCAGLLKAASRHLLHRTQRAMEFCISQNLFHPSVPRSLVISGGVANNDYIFKALEYMASHYDCQSYRPSKKYCSDNGVMIAWNAMEQLMQNMSCLRWDFDNISEYGRAELGRNISSDVEKADIKCKWIQPKTQ